MCVIYVHFFPGRTQKIHYKWFSQADAFGVHIPYRRIYYASLDYYATFGKFEYNATFLPLKSTFWAKIRLQRQFLGKKFEYNVT